METFTQKKFTISLDQKEVLADCKKWGFSDQSSIVREALNRFIKELGIKQRKDVMKKKAQELLADYVEDEELTIFDNLDGEDFI